MLCCMVYNYAFNMCFQCFVLHVSHMYTYSLVLLGNLNSKFICMYAHQYSYKYIVLQYVHCHVFYNDGKCFDDTRVIKIFCNTHVLQNIPIHQRRNSALFVCHLHYIHLSACLGRLCLQGSNFCSQHTSLSFPSAYLGKLCLQGSNFHCKSAYLQTNHQHRFLCHYLIATMV